MSASDWLFSFVDNGSDPDLDCLDMIQVWSQNTLRWFWQFVVGLSLNVAASDLVLDQLVEAIHSGSNGLDSDIDCCDTIYGQSQRILLVVAVRGGDFVTFTTAS